MDKSIDHTEVVAQALCAHDGLDPDKLELASLTSGSLLRVPAWERYRKEADRFMVAFQAMLGCGIHPNYLTLTASEGGRLHPDAEDYGGPRAYL